MAIQEAIVNQFDGPFPASKYDTKYFKYLGNVRENSGTILEAFRTKNIDNIEKAIRSLTDSIKNHIFLIGMGCVIIDREQLYIDAGFHSYLEYAKRLYEATGLSPQSISAAKIIIERFLDYNSDLRKHGFDLEHNSNKLLYLEIALENHDNRNEVFKHAANDTFREFLSYARSSDSQRRLAPPAPKVKIEEGKILVNGKNILNFPKDLPVAEKEFIGRCLSEVYTIRAAGNEPLIIETYDEREARVLKKRIATLIKELRSTK